MRLRRLICSTKLFEFSLFGAGTHEIHVAIESGIPQGARLRWMGMVGAEVVACDFEHESFDEVQEGSIPPAMGPVCVRRIEATQGGGVG